jgi:hypothetical protein
MYGLSLSKILQEAGITEGRNKIRHLSGGIKNIEQLLQPEVIGKLESLHVGVFSFLAFHPNVDTDILAYVEKGSLASDSGRQIMVLFIGSSEIRSPRRIEKSDLELNLDLDTTVHPAYIAVEALFSGKKVDVPGLVFFNHLLQPTNSIYVPLSEPRSLKEVTVLCRKIFSIATNAFNASNKTRQDYIERFAVQLEKKRVRYYRSQKTSFREWLIKICNTIYDHRGDIISVVPLLK